MIKININARIIQTNMKMFEMKKLFNKRYHRDAVNRQNEVIKRNERKR